MPPIIDLIVRIKNGYMSRKESVTSSYSTYRETVLKKLKKLGYIQDYRVEGEIVKHIVIDLLYQDGVPAVTDIKLFSTPGRRWYVAAQEVKSVLGGLGRAFVSTSKGVLTDKEIKKEGVGGELLFHIW